MAHPVHELTTATILFTDVVDSTATRTRLGEEPADRVFAHHARLLRTIVRAHRATFVKSVGDGVMAVFDSASEGLRAAAAIQHAVTAERDRASTALEVRGGLSSGDIVWTDDDVDGLPAIEAARLAGAASGGQILCSELTARLACGRGGLAFKDIGSLELKGLARSLPTVEVLWWQQLVTPTPPPAWLTIEQLLPFVGREAELALLSGWLARTVDRPAIAIIEGDPGAGKTRLLAEVVRLALSRDHVLMAGRCTNPPARPLEPFAEAVTRMASDSAALVLAAHGRDDLTELARLTPVLTKAPFGFRSDPSLDPKLESARLVSALAALISHVGSAAPVVLAIDDVQWATTSTLELLRGLLHRLEDTPLHVVATLRGASLGGADRIPLLADLLAQAELTRVALPGLTADDIASALLAGNEAGNVSIPVVESARIATISGGNAFLVTETIRELRTGRKVGDDTAPPETIQRFISGRVGRLGAVARDAVETTACAGRIELGSLRLALGVDDGAFVAALDEALATGLVVASNDGVLAMAHELARAGVNGRISPPRAALLHRRIVGALTAIEPDIETSRAYRLAEHRVAIAWLGAPDDIRLARDAARSAAEHAMSRLAYDEAVAWMERSIQFHDRLHDVAPAVRAELMVELGRAKWRSGDQDARAVLRDAGRAAQVAGRPDLLIAAALAGSRGFFSTTAAPDERSIDLLSAALAAAEPHDFAKRAELTAYLAAELTWAPEGERRFALSDEALELARRSGDERALIRVLAARSLTISAADTLDQRLADSEELMRFAMRSDDELLRFHAVFQRSAPLFEAGDLVGAGEMLDQSRRLAQTLGQPELQWLVEFSMTGLVLMLGDVGSAEIRAGDALRMGVAAGRRMEALAFHSEQLAEIRRLQGRLDELVAQMSAVAGRSRLDPVHSVLRYLCEAGAPGVDDLLDRAIASSVPPRRDLAERAALDNLIFVAARLGRCELLPVLYEVLLPSAATFCHSAVGHPCGHHYLALAAAALDDAAAADAHFAAAAELHERAGVPLVLAESLIEWLRLLVRQDRRDPAREAELHRRASAALASGAAPMLDARLREVVR